MDVRIPTWENCDRTDPRTRLKPAFVGLPWAGQQKFTPPSDLAEDWSEHCDAIGVVYVGDIAALADENGMIHVDQLPVPRLKLVPPYRGPQHPMNATMRWVDVDEPEPEPVMIPDVSAKVHTREEQEIIAEQLYHDGVIPRPETAVETASVERTFNPSDYTPSEVRGYLIGADDRERARVLALEMTGKARPQILNDPRWRGL
ncbi:DUF2744 domain-containing protein [Rhodococcus hoagii]|nr:DUF2744 domain-containing protein [Prescottella equi]NKR79462.1 DUF2744 domain-containing protein [Prescottella equi]NKR80058.1 DUF2744 domain-containing protein [Prescottella equi]NKT01855.1 DUF2744 domain-containing protein [Prescottella equi]NKT02677.1 DUF2744 domain-containing protein [Prescottella equi]